MGRRRHVKRVSQAAEVNIVVAGQRTCSSPSPERTVTFSFNVFVPPLAALWSDTKSSPALRSITIDFTLLADHVPSTPSIEIILSNLAEQELVVTVAADDD